MKTTALLLTLTLGTAAFAAEEPSQPVRRTWLTGVGISLVGAGLAVSGFGLNALFTAQDSDRLLKLYYPSEGVVPKASEISTVAAIESRRTAANSLIVPAFAIAGGSAAAGLICILVDALMGQPASKYVAQFSIVPSSAGFTLLGRF